MRDHISGQYDSELDSARGHLMEMGGMVEAQLQLACDALIQVDAGKAQRAIDGDRAINQLEISIDEECKHIIARRQPTASDLRLVMSIIKTITDLERIGDEASRIAKMARKLADMERGRDQYSEIRDMAGQVRSMLRAALDAFARVDVQAANSVIRNDKQVDRLYDDLVERLVPAMETDPRSIRRLLGVMWSARSFERIGDHAKNICEYVVFLAHGEDVRHSVDTP